MKIAEWFLNAVKVKSYEPSGPLLLELIPVFCSVTRSIATPHEWDASPSQVTSQHFIRFP